MPDISIALGLLRKPLEALGGVASGKTKEYLARLKAEQRVKTIHQHLYAVQKVKTIWNLDRPLTISSFYYPASVRTPAGETQQLTGLDDLPSSHVVLQGTVGQGKSILLRWLVGREARSGSRIPLFVELRRIPNGGFDDFLLQKFKDLLGPSADEALFDLFASHSRLSLLLDGFDELAPENVGSISTSLERLAHKYPHMRILVTSRPDSGIEHSPLFDVVPIAKLTPTQLPDFFSKILGRDKDLAKRLTAAVRIHPNISQLVSTPLLATLLTIVYRAHQRIPLDFSEFYDELFQILMVRHDKAKLGYDRYRRTKLGDRQMQQIFEAFCYKTKAMSKTSIERPKALEIVRASIDAMGVECGEAHFLDDIEKVTCLLSEEGGRVEFVHQSVQEFFAARYIASRPDGVAAKFYGQVGDQNRWMSWQQELNFLAQIDAYRASKYFYLPMLRHAVQHLTATDQSQQASHLRSMTADTIAVRQECVGVDQKPLTQPKYFVVHLPRSAFYMQAVFDNRMFAYLFTENKTWREAFKPGAHGQLLTYAEIASAVGLADGLATVLKGTLSTVVAEIAKHDRVVKASDDSEAFIQL